MAWKALVDVCRRVYAKGWVANHDGNATALLDGGRVLATPTAWSKGDVDEAALLVTDMGGKRVSGTTRPFSELNLHLEVYKRRADARAVLHAHPPFATSLACAGRALGRPFIAEAIVSLGDDVPLVPYAAPGPIAASALAPFVDRCDAMLLASHGVLTMGADPMQAFLRMELVEHLARILISAAAVGGVKPIPDADVVALLAARAKAGLGPRVTSAPAPATASAPATATVSAGERARMANLSAWAPETRRQS